MGIGDTALEDGAGANSSADAVPSKLEVSAALLPSALVHPAVLEWQRSALCGATLMLTASLRRLVQGVDGAAVRRAATSSAPKRPTVRRPRRWVRSERPRGP